MAETGKPKLPEEHFLPRILRHMMPKTVSHDAAWGPDRPKFKPTFPMEFGDSEMLERSKPKQNPRFHPESRRIDSK